MSWASSAVGDGRQRRRSTSFEETHLPKQSVSLIARRPGMAANQLFAWYRLMAQGALTAAGYLRGTRYDGPGK